MLCDQQRVGHHPPRPHSGPFASPLIRVNGHVAGVSRASVTAHHPWRGHSLDPSSPATASATNPPVRVPELEHQIQDLVVWTQRSQEIDLSPDSRSSDSGTKL